jgi:hypothetical protein
MVIDGVRPVRLVEQVGIATVDPTAIEQKAIAYCFSVC